jgi:hypothetical protein
MFKAARGSALLLARGGAVYALHAASSHSALHCEDKDKEGRDRPVLTAGSAGVSAGGAPKAVAGPPKASWASYGSPVAWYQWSTLGADDYHFKQFLANSGSNSGMMTWPSLVKGIAEREKDEELTRQKMTDAQAILAGSRSMDAIEKKRIISDLSAELTEVMYGKGVTMEQRQQHLALYGCALYTEEALDIIAQQAANRGVIEIGAGESLGIC